jgi:poly(hydroxyalkanoate) granule-associated protein
MATKGKRTDEAGTEAGDTSDLAGTIRQSAQQIWLAGLGAFSKAQEEGGKVFQALVKEGVDLQRKTQGAAGDKLNEATSRMASMANDLSSRASGQWDKLESLFEDRVARALKKMGVPTSREIDELVARIDELNRTVAALRGAERTARARKASVRRSPERPAAKAAARKRASARKASAE